MSSGLTREGLNKFQVVQTVTGTGAIGNPSGGQYTIKGEHYFKCETIGSGGGNIVLIEGRILSGSWVTIATLTADEIVSFDATTYDYIRFSCTTYGGSEFTFLASGFYVIPATLEELDDLLDAINQQYKNAADTFAVTSPGVANTEFSQALSAGVKEFIIRARGPGPGLIRLAYAAGDIASGDYITIYPGEVRGVDNLKTFTQSLYMSCSKASQVIEIEEWT